MRLTWRIVIRISLLMSVVLAVWAILFNNAVINEVNDETDDSLEFFSENLIKKILRGEELPSVANGTNNTYFLEPVTNQYARTKAHLTYSNEIVYIDEKEESEPARVLRVIFQDDNDKYYQLTVATPTIETEDLQDALTNWIITLYTTLLLLTITVCLWVLWRSMRPLYKILNWLEHNDISKGVEPLVNPTNINEFKHLNQAIMRSAQRSEQLYTQQKQFTGNASHEIQTPIAVCKNRLDLLLDTPLNEHQMGEIIKVQQTLTYISRLNKELLLLAKIDGGQFTDTEEIDISKLAAAAAEDCSMVYNHQSSNIKINTNQPLITTINSTLASVMITNLIRNAFTHTTQQGEIEITTNHNSIIITNSGNTALNKEQLFQRFYQEKKREGSSGLGLAMVKSISDLYRYQATYNFQDKTHTFKIIFNNK